MKKILLALFAACCFFSISCYAAVELNSDIENHTYTLSGTVKEAGFNQKVSVVVKNSSGVNVFYGAQETDNNGAFSYTFKLADLTKGSYTAYVGAYNLASPAKVVPDIFFMADTDIDTLLASVNDIKTSYEAQIITKEKAVNDILSVLASEENKKALEINTSMYTLTDGAGKSAIAEKILVNAPYTSLTGLSQLTNEQMAIELIRCASESNVESIVQNMKAVLKFESSPLYSQYTALSTKKAVLTRMAGTRYSNITALRKGFEKALLLEKLYLAENLDTATKIYDNHKAVFEIDFTAYTGWTNRDLALASYKTYFKDTPTLKTALDTAYNVPGGDNGGGNEGGNDGSGGSGSGGGGGRSDIITVLPAQTVGSIFTDVPQGHWAKDAIESLYKDGVLSGTGNGMMEPDRSVTRAEFIKMAAIAFKIEDSSAQSSFSDVSTTHWSYPFISSLAEKGIVNGVSDGFFNAQGAVTRQDMAIIIGRIAEYKKTQLEKKREYTAFPDMEQIADYARDAVVYLYECGIVNGFEDGSFKPAATTTRAQAATLIYNMQKSGKE